MAGIKRTADVRGKSSQVQAIGHATKASTSSTGYLATTKLKKAGGSLVMTAPAAARNVLGLTEGQEMAVSVKGTQIIVEPVPSPEKAPKVRRPKYTLDELIAGYDADVPLTDDERAWMDVPPAGCEVW